MEKRGYTPHINASFDAFAETVLIPGDPKRSKFIAENFLKDIRLVNDVRGVQGYTGLYKGVPVSVMASGMGMPSMAIYSYELFNFFDVQKIIRVGSAGAYSEDVKVRDIVIASGASTDSNYLKHLNLSGDFAPTASFPLLNKCVSKAEELGYKYHVGNILSTDVFYSDTKAQLEKWGRLGILAVEMEAAALYTNAALSKKQALAVCTISDSLVTGEALPPEDRERSFEEMIILSLNTAI